MTLVLASGSRIRAELLKNAGLAFDVDPATVDERAVEAPLLEAGLCPEDLATILAEAKAQDVSERRPTSKASPAFFRSSARMWLPLASTRVIPILVSSCKWALKVQRPTRFESLEQGHDFRSGFLNGTTCYVDQRPIVFRAQAPRHGDFARDFLAVNVCVIITV